MWYLVNDTIKKLDSKSENRYIPSQNRKVGITKIRELTLEISRINHKEKLESSRSEVAKSRGELGGGQKLHRYRILFDMMATHWRLRARLRDISPKIKFIRRDANRVFIGHIASQGKTFVFF